MPPRKVQKACEEEVEVVTTNVVDSDSDSDRESDVKVVQDSDSDSDDEPEVVKKVAKDSDSDSDVEPEDEPVVVKKVTQKKKNVPKAKAAPKAKVEEKEGSEEEVTKRHVMTPIERIDLVIKKMEETGLSNTKDIMNQMVRLRKQLDGAKIKQTTTTRAPTAYNLWMKDKMALLKGNDMNPRERFSECIRMWNENKKLKLETAQ